MNSTKVAKTITFTVIARKLSSIKQISFKSVLIRYAPCITRGGEFHGWMDKCKVQLSTESVGIPVQERALRSINMRDWRCMNRQHETSVSVKPESNPFCHT